MAGHVDPVAQRIGAEQRGAQIVAEDIDQGAGVDRVDMLGVERQAGARQPVRDAGMNGAQASDRGEKAQCAAVRSLDQAGISGGQRGDVSRFTSVTISTSAWAA
jgi:hypothetical protein